MRFLTSTPGGQQWAMWTENEFDEAAWRADPASYMAKRLAEQEKNKQPTQQKEDL